MKWITQLPLPKNSIVAIETTPIYLCDEPNILHKKSILLANAIDQELRKRQCFVSHTLLLDEYSWGEQPGIRNKYQALFPFKHNLVQLEGELIDHAKKLLTVLPERFYTKGFSDKSGFRRLKRSPSPILIKNNGLPACALLDTTFQLQKKVDLNIIIHPEEMTVNGINVNFAEQQQGVLSVLQSLRYPNKPAHPSIPWRVGLIHVWLDQDGNVKKVRWTRNKGRGIKVSNLSFEEITKDQSEESPHFFAEKKQYDIVYAV